MSVWGVCFTWGSRNSLFCLFVRWPWLSETCLLCVLYSIMVLSLFRRCSSVDHLNSLSMFVILLVISLIILNISCRWPLNHFYSVFEMFLQWMPYGWTIFYLGAYIILWSVCKLFHLFVVCFEISSIDNVYTVAFNVLRSYCGQGVVSRRWSLLRAPLPFHHTHLAFTWVADRTSSV